MRNRYVAAVVLAVAAWGRIQAAEDIQPGLIAEYFEFESGLGDFPAIPPNMKPVIRRVDRQINVDDCSENFNNTNLNKNFYVKWTGSVKIDKKGKHKFFLESDDGSRLFIDGKQVIDNGGTHGMVKKDCELDLAPGQHELKIEFFQGDGGMGCKFSWVQPGKGEEIVNENFLWHKTDAE